MAHCVTSVCVSGPQASAGELIRSTSDRAMAKRNVVAAVRFGSDARQYAARRFLIGSIMIL